VSNSGVFCCLSNNRAGTILAPPPPPPRGGGGGEKIKSPQVRRQAFLYDFFFDFFLRKLLTKCDFSDNFSPMKTQNMINQLDEITFGNFGRARSLSIAGRSCVTCGKRADTFKDALSEKEFGISGMCQACQDEVFCEPEE
jgi:hypothetical protein